MNPFLYFTLFGTAFAVAANKCNADNCARAITGTQAGPARSAVRVAECGTAQTCSVLPAVTTQVTSCTTTVPATLTTACANTAAYVSACKCAGATAGTTIVTSLPTPSTTPSTFKIYDKTNNLIAGLNTDGQEYGNVGLQVLSETDASGVSPLFTLSGTQLQTVEISPRVAYNYPGDASKLYFSSASGPAPQYSSDTGPYVVTSCSLGAFDGTVPGYLLDCTNAHGYSNVFVQGATQNYGLGPAGFSESSPPGPDTSAGPLYAVQV